MNLRSTARSVAALAWPLFLLLSALAGRELPPGDPALVHRFLRENLSLEAEARDVLNQWQLQTGDYSFDSFAHDSTRLKNSLKLQSRAARLWEEGDLTRALELYRIATRALGEAGADSESAFSLYYIAEILYEMERPLESLQMVRHALRRSARAGVPRHYLEALLWQSRGYSLWFLDHPRASVLAFGEAQERWRHLRHAEGESTTWNNLGVLYEELQMPSKAEHCYRTALALLPAGAQPSVHLQLRLNLSLLLLPKDRAEAVAQLKEASRFIEGDRFEFLLVGAQVQPTAYRNQLMRTTPGSRTRQVERLLTLAKTTPEQAEKFELLAKAAALARDLPTRRVRRNALTEMASLLEKEAQYEKALELYLSALRDLRPIQIVPDLVYPYARAESPLIQGAVRCLVELGRADEAWTQIQTQCARRRQQASQVVHTPLELGSLESEMDRLLEAVRLSRPKSSGASSSTQPVCRPVSPSFRPSGYSILELWPTQQHVLVWILNPAGRRFRKLPMGLSTAELSRTLATGFQDAGSALPHPPSVDLLNRVHRELFAPIEGLIETRRLLVVAHGTLQGLPLEMLIDRDSQLLLQKYAFSYLPSLCLPQSQASNRRAPAVMLQPGGSPPPGQTRERRELSALFPGLRTVTGLNASAPVEGSVIHVSSHFRLRRDHWLNSNFDPGPRAIRIDQFLNQPLSCRLLSLGVCDGGNTASWQPPYALGLAELLLMRPVGGIILSRWKLDELSLPIYFDVLRLAGRGEPVDLALAKARQRFIRGKLHRSGFVSNSSHPFFWAGVAFVGLPGHQVREGRSSSPALSVFAFLVGMAILIGWGLQRLRARIRIR